MAAGLLEGDHAQSAIASAELSRLIAARERLVTDVCVFTDIMERYASSGRAHMIQKAFDLLSGIVDDVAAVSVDIVNDSKAILLSYPSLTAREAIHVAAMRALEVDRILTLNKGYDVVPNVERVPRI